MPKSNVLLSEKYNHISILRVMSEAILSWSSPITTTRDYIIVCIGTDRSTGDSLGPLTGTYLTDNYRLNHLKVYGTLHNPVHAKNLSDYIKKIYNKYPNPCVIAVDASLGRLSSVGKIFCGKGPLKPGAAFNKPLDPVGNLHLTGVVNVAGFMDYSVLQSTRLSLVNDMAKQLAKILFLVDYKMTNNHLIPLKANN